MQLIVGLVKAILEVFTNIEKKEEEDFKDVGRKQPENPDDAFKDSDW